MSALASAVTFSITAVFGAGGIQSQASLPTSAANSLIMLITACICSWPNTTAPNITSSGNSFASDSTIITAVAVAATTKSSSVSFICVADGLMMYSPSI